MKHEIMKILIVIKNGSLLKNGEAPIVRVTINGVPDELRIQRNVLPRLFYHNSKCYLSFAVVFQAQGATVEAHYLARDGKADA